MYRERILHDLCTLHEHGLTDLLDINFLIFSQISDCIGVTFSFFKPSNWFEFGRRGEGGWGLETVDIISLNHNISFISS